MKPDDSFDKKVDDMMNVVRIGQTTYVLTFYSIIMPIDALEYFGKWTICSFRANAPFFYIFKSIQN